MTTTKKQLLTQKQIERIRKAEKTRGEQTNQITVRERERHTHTHRQADRQTDSQADRGGERDR